MTKKLKGYYLPQSFEDIEEELEFVERELSDISIITPKYFSPEVAEKIARKLKSNHEHFNELKLDEIAEVYEKVGKQWSKTSENPKKAIALKYLPELIGYSSEIIDYFQFTCISQISQTNCKDMVNYRFPMKVFREFIQIPETQTWIRAYASLLDKIRLKRIMSSDLRELKMITYITPKNVSGIIESIGIFLGNIVKSTVIVKTPFDQPLFAPLYAETVNEISPILGETIVIVPWKGGNKELERVIYSYSDVVSIVSSNRTINIIKKEIQKLNKQGCNIKGCYHGQKFGLELVAKEYLQEEETARKVAALIAIDNAGYEGYMCASPAFGTFIEKGEKIDGVRFAEILAEESCKVAELLPQNEEYSKRREQKLAELNSSSKSKRELFRCSDNRVSAIYEPDFELNPIGQNRLLRVFEIQSLEQLINRIKPWRKYLQTIGIAIPNYRLLEQKIAKKLGKIGFSSLRVVGSVCIPRLGETWDGNYPIYEYYIPDFLHWQSINAPDVTLEIGKLYDEYQKSIIG